ncbi:hypothetical protein JCM12178A_09830 [Salidesulfovibrio brasiliensis]
MQMHPGGRYRTPFLAHLTISWQPVDSFALVCKSFSETFAVSFAEVAAMGESEPSGIVRFPDFVP